jgi:hypothetical protein
MFEGTLLCIERNNSEFVALGRSEYGSSIRLNWEPRNLDWHKHISHFVRRPRFKAGKFDEMCDTLMSRTCGRLFLKAVRTWSCVHEGGAL